MSKNPFNSSIFCHKSISLKYELRTSNDYALMGSLTFQFILPALLWAVKGIHFLLSVIIFSLYCCLLLNLEYIWDLLKVTFWRILKPIIASWWVTGRCQAVNHLALWSDLKLSDKSLIIPEEAEGSKLVILMSDGLWMKKLLGCKTIKSLHFTLLFCTSMLFYFLKVCDYVYYYTWLYIHIYLPGDSSQPQRN